MNELTVLEIDTLQACANKFVPVDVAASLGISARAFYSRMSRIYNKLNEHDYLKVYKYAREVLPAE